MAKISSTPQRVPSWGGHIVFYSIDTRALSPEVKRRKGEFVNCT